MAVLTGVTNKRFDAASLNALLAKIKESHDTLASNLADAIADLDSKTTDLEGGKFLTGVTLTDGKITAQTAEGLASADKSVTIDGYDLAVNVDGSTIKKDADGKLYADPANLDQYKVVKVETGLDANVKEAYKLVKNDADIAGSELVKIYKDSSVEDVHIGVATANEKEWDADSKSLVDKDPEVKENPQKLYLTYLKADGSKEVVSVDFSSFIAEAEMGNGMQVSNHKIAIKLAADTEAFLSVDENGLKLSGVQDAIDAAKAEAKTAIVEVAADAAIPDAGAPKVVVTKSTDATTKQDTYTISGQDLASAKVLAALIAEFNQFKADVIDTFNNMMSESDVNSAWDTAMA